MKSLIVDKVLRSLLDAGFSVSDCQSTQSCFDVLARRGSDILLIKVLANVDGLTQRNAFELMKVASILSAKCVVVGDHMKSSRLMDGVVYDRYGVQVMSFKTLEGVFSGSLPSVYSIRGDYCVQIDPGLLIKLRERRGMVQQELADLLVVSKQSVYRYESSGKMSLDVAEKLVSIFNDRRLIKPTGVFTQSFFGVEGESSNQYLSPLKRIVMKVFHDMGFSAELTNAPFDMVVEGDEMVFTAVSNDCCRLRKRMGVVNDITDIVGGYSVCITERRVSVESPVLRVGELQELRSAREFFEVISE